MLSLIPLCLFGNEETRAFRRYRGLFSPPHGLEGLTTFRGALALACVFVTLICSRPDRCLADDSRCTILFDGPWRKSRVALTLLPITGVNRFGSKKNRIMTRVYEVVAEWRSPRKSLAQQVLDQVRFCIFRPS